MRRLTAVLLLVVGAACPPAAAALLAPDAQAPVEVEVVKEGGRWVADYRFRSRASTWLFSRSAVTRIGERPWRPRSWTVETPGVRLERHGFWDLLVAENGRMPPHVRIRIEPFAGDLLGDYDPALLFSDGSAAIFSGQFSVVPVRSVARAAALPADLARSGLTQSRTRMRFRDSAGPVLQAGRRVEVAVVDGDSDGTYVLFGPAEPVEGEAMAAVIDPQLPAWIRSALERSIPDILERYAAALGPPPGPRPTVMVSWAGPTRGVTSMGGSVLPGLITMAYEGDGVLLENPATRGHGLWFIAHESAHFWLGNLVAYEYSRDSWITEGGADLLAFRTVAAVDPGYDWRGALGRSIADCVRLAQGRGVATAEERNEQRAYYACGAVFSLVAEAASGGSFPRFVRGLIDANRDDGTVSRREWLAALDRASGDPSLSADIGRMLDRGADDPKAAIAALFTRAGIAHELAEDGMPGLR